MNGVEDMDGTTRPVSMAALTRLRARAGRAVRVALMGEFSSGKSTLLNLLAGDEVAPTQVVATHVPNLWLHTGGGGTELVLADGSRSRVDGDWRHDPRLGEAACVRVARAPERLEGLELIDTPGISDPLATADPLSWAERRADLVLWCTPAAQAWRQSEKMSWLARPRHLRARSLLVVTQADRLTPADLDKVLARLRKEAGPQFAGLLPVSALAAAEGTEAAWRESGVGALVARIRTAASELQGQRQALLARYRLAELPSEAPVAAAEARAPAEAEDAPRADPPAPDFARWPSDPVALWDAVCARALPDEAPAVTIRHFFSEFADPDLPGSPAEPPWAPLVRSAAAADAVDPERLLQQVRGELADFQKDVWCDLAPTSGPAG